MQLPRSEMELGEETVPGGETILCADGEGELCIKTIAFLEFVGIE